jgi:hypothetical protein
LTLVPELPDEQQVSITTRLNVSTFATEQRFDVPFRVEHADDLGGVEEAERNSVAPALLGEVDRDVGKVSYRLRALFNAIS